MNYAEVIRARRTALGMNQAELAEKTGVSRNTVAGWETGHSRPDPDTIPRLCDALRISINRFFGRESKRTEAEQKILSLFASLESGDRQVILWQMEALRDRRAFFRADKDRQVQPIIRHTVRFMRRNYDNRGPFPVSFTGTPGRISVFHPRGSFFTKFFRHTFFHSRSCILR